MWLVFRVVNWLFDTLIWKTPCQFNQVARVKAKVKKNRQYSYGQHKTIITIKGQSKTVCYESEKHFVKVYKVVVKLYRMCTMRFQLIFGLKFICLFSVLYLIYFLFIRYGNVWYMTETDEQNPW